MTVREQPLPQRRTIAWNKVAAFLAWFGGVFTTWLFFQAAIAELPWFIALTAAGLIQWMLTLAEKPLWRYLLKRGGGKLSGVALIVTLLDASLNAAGIYPFTSRLAQTGVGQMFAEVFNVQAAVSAQPSFLLAFLIGLLLASLPEALWES